MFSPGFLQFSGGSGRLGRDWEWIYSFGVTGFVSEGGPTSVGNGVCSEQPNVDLPLLVDIKN